MHHGCEKTSVTPYLAAHGDWMRPNHSPCAPNFHLNNNDHVIHSPLSFMPATPRPDIFNSASKQKQKIPLLHIASGLHADTKSLGIAGSANSRFCILVFTLFKALLECCGATLGTISDGKQKQGAAAAVDDGLHSAGLESHHICMQEVSRDKESGSD